MVTPNKYLGMMPVTMTVGNGLPKMVQRVPGDFNDWRPDDNVQADPTISGKDGQDWRIYNVPGAPKILPGQNP